MQLLERRGQRGRRVHRCVRRIPPPPRQTNCPCCGASTTTTRGTGYCIGCKAKRAGKKAGEARRKKMFIGPRVVSLYGIKVKSYSRVWFHSCLWCSGPISNAPRRKTKPKYCCNLCCIRHHSTKKTNIDDPITCLSCGSIFNKIYVSGRNSPGLKTCSSACSVKRSVETEKAQRRKAKAARRARIVESAELEIFDPFEIFNRDGWQCQACGVSTPKDLRGTYNDNAPELDHIVPLSKGGAHKRHNCQCLCRGCNIRKSDRLMDEFVGNGWQLRI